MEALKQFRKTINAILESKGYPINYGWDDLEGKTFQDEAFIQAAIVIDDAIQANL